MKQQKMVRTFPDNFLNATGNLKKALDDGWLVVSRSSFNCGNGQHGNEYILEKTKEKQQY